MNKVIFRAFLEVLAIIFAALFCCTVDSLFTHWLVSGFGLAAIALIVGCKFVDAKFRK